MTAVRRDRARRFVSTVVSAAMLAFAAVAASGSPVEAQARVTRSGEIKLERMRFAVVQGAGTPWIVADGDIMPGTAEAFRAVARRWGLQGARVLINSRGGSLLAGVQLGLEFRRL